MLTAFHCIEGGLLEFILSSSNLNTAYKRIKSNKGSGGVDRMNLDMLLDYPWSVHNPFHLRWQTQATPHTKS